MDGIRPLPKTEYDTLGSIKEKFQTLLSEKGPAPPQTLYHYTTVLALVSIISGMPTPEFWATEALCMADTSECLYAASMVKPKLEKVGAPANTIAHFDHGHAKAVLTSEVFVASFCSERDSMPHWQNYGDQCRGCAIEFDRTILAQALGDYREFSLVRYGQTALDTFFDPFIAYLEARAAGSATPDCVWHWGANKLFQSLSFFKREEFRHETEYRMTVLPQNGHPINLRLDRGRAIQYLPVKFAPAAIRSVLLGPDCNALNERVLQQAFARIQPHTGHLVTVARSAIGRELLL